MSLLQHLKEGLDPTGQTCISFADLLQMIRNAMPWPKQGFVIFQSTAPNVILYPEMAYFLWVRTVDDVNYVPVSPTEIYYYNGTYWIDLTKMDGSRLIPASVALSALTLAGASAYDIIHVNAVGNALEYVSIPTAIQTDTIPVDRLVAPDLTNNYILTCFAGTKTFKLVADFFTGIDDNIIPVVKLVRAAADPLGFYLRTKIDGSGIEWANVDVANIAAAGFAAGQSIRRNAGNNGWEGFVAPSSCYPTYIAPLSVYSGGAVAWTNSSASIPGGTIPVDAIEAILQIDGQNTSAADGSITTQIRKNSLGSIYTGCYTGGTSGVGTASSQQGRFLVDAGTFDFQVTATVTPCLVNIVLIGYTK